MSQFPLSPAVQGYLDAARAGYATSAAALDMPLLQWHIKSTTKAQQGLYEYDAVSRLRDSQLGDERVKDMIFDDDPYSEDPGEVDLKLAVLDIYNHNLTKRAEKKRVIFEHGFLEHKKKQQWEKRWNKEEREVVNKTKPLARLQNAADYETLVDGLVGMSFYV